jgi:hypothetical protein
MFDLDNLPPRRELPPSVRARARQRLGEMIGDRPARPVRTGIAIAVVAAAVVVTAVGVPFVASRSSLGETSTPDGNPISDTEGFRPALYDLRDSATVADAERCAAEGWKPLFTASSGGVTLITLSSGGKLRFCELTPEAVALSAPAARPASGARITYVSATGTVAGVVADDEQYVTVEDAKQSPADGGTQVSAELRDGVFVIPHATTGRPESLTLLLGWNRTPVKDTPVPAVVTLRKDRPQPTRAGQFLCDGRTDIPPLVDAHAWQTAAAPVTLSATERVQTARYGGLLAFCLVDDDGNTARLDVTDGHSTVSPWETDDNPWVLALGAFYHFTGPGADTSSSTMVFCGLTKDPTITSITVQGDGEPVTAPVVDGMFVLPGVSTALDELYATTADGKHHGPISIGL